MPVATTTRAGRTVVSDAAQTVINNATAERARKLAAARQAADTLTPLGDAPLFPDGEPPATPDEQLRAIGITPTPRAYIDPPAAAKKPAATFTIHALMDDFPFEVQFTGSAETLAATVARLRDLGAVPPTPAARAAVEAEKARSAPVCEFHGPMKESSKAPGSWYCPAKMGNGDYCKSKG